jgi:predicted DsbA family dithiol-disulfide isomerase
MKLTVEIISDVICPWCFIGKRRFERALRLLPEGVEAEVHWRPFELNPDMPAEGIDRKSYRTRKFGSWGRSQALDAQLAQVGAEEGIRFAFDRMERTPNTLEAHRLIWLAGKQGVRNAVVEALFHAYFEEALNVGDRDVLTRVASGAGMDVREFLESDRGRDEVAAEEVRARRMGVDGVPFFLIGGTIPISGAQPPESLAAAMSTAVSAALNSAAGS